MLLLIADFLKKSRPRIITNILGLYKKTNNAKTYNYFLEITFAETCEALAVPVSTIACVSCPFNCCV